MKKVLALIAVLMMVVNCSEAPFDPDRGASVVIGSWGGTSKITYPGPADEPITEVAGIVFNFGDDGRYSFYQQREYDTNRGDVYTGKYIVNGSTLMLIADYGPMLNSPFNLAGNFQITEYEDAIHLYQISGGAFPLIHELTLSKWVVVLPVNPLLGGWSGMSHITYPNEVDAPTRDSLEISMFFQSDFSFSFSALGDSLSDPFIHYGTYEWWYDRVVLTITDDIPYNSPLNLKGSFVMMVTDSSLRLYQHPEHIWPTIHDVQLTSTHSVSYSFGQRQTPSHDR